ncbi:MAG: helix-turn-helix domain-containing protein [Oscillospiraceae bacterium]|jgi:transcriptional regulator with XRE-family HTH domain|nr:helix-turn-helix domain-containing protein [Oscillospiraceae bacterium]
MTVYFGEVFKALRKAKDMTQEQAAEALCVSPQAVSRWECASSFPDISLLPVIADYFKVSIEELLGVEQSHREAKVKEYLERFGEAMAHGYVEECIEIARSAIRDFPNNYELQNMLMYALFVSGDDSGNIHNWQENVEKYKEEIIEIGERILKNCTDDAIRLEAKARLGFHYCEIGEFDKGKAVFESLPAEDSSREANLYWALRGDDRLCFLRERTKSLCEGLVWNLWRYARCSGICAAEHIACIEACEQVVNTIFHAEDYGDWFWVFARFYAQDKAPQLLSLGAREKALEALETAEGYLYAELRLPEVYKHTSPLVEDCLSEKKRDTADLRPLARIVLDDVLSMPCYDEIRQDVRFAGVCERLRSM